VGVGAGVLPGGLGLELGQGLGFGLGPLGRRLGNHQPQFSAVEPLQVGQHQLPLHRIVGEDMLQ
jgi:hypothetical protein